MVYFGEVVGFSPLFSFFNRCYLHCEGKHKFLRLMTFESDLDTA